MQELPPRGSTPSTKPRYGNQPILLRSALGGRRSRRAELVLRSADVVVAASLLLLTLPLSLLVALAIRLDGSGPVLHRQPRRGRGGQHFHLLSFRSTEEGAFGRPVPTRLGRLIRPARIDQLPVLLNLLRGDMTLVGPAPADTSGGSAAQATRLPRPGVSGWAGAD